MLWRVYIDEAGDRGISPKSSAHFVTSAIAIRDDDERRAREELDGLRQALGRQPDQVLHFQRFTHSQRLKAVQDLSASSVAAIFNTVLCKREFSEPAPGDVKRIVNEGHRFRVDTPKDIRLLQFADTVASALFRALEPDEYGNHERRYLDELRPKLYRRESARSLLTG